MRIEPRAASMQRSTRSSAPRSGAKAVSIRASVGATTRGVIALALVSRSAKPGEAPSAGCDKEAERISSKAIKERIAEILCGQRSRRRQTPFLWPPGDAQVGAASENANLVR